MGIKGFDGDLSEESKKALQSETWQAAREGMKEKKEVMHFTNNPETKGIAEVKIGYNDNAYGVKWANLVREYLKTAYVETEKQCEVESFGKTYMVLKRDTVTVFYDAVGNTLFDVANERLEKEYEWLMSNGTKEVPEHGELEDNGDAEKNIAVDQEETDTEVGEVPAEERATEEEKETPDDEAEQSGNMEAMPKDIGGKAMDKKEKSAKYSGIDGAITKLQEELKKADPKEFAEPVIEYLTERCRESESLAADICQDHKTWKKCYDYIVSNARKKLNNVSGPVRSDIVFEWAEDYYRKDDKAEEEKQAKKAAEDKAKREKIAAPKKIETPKESPKPKRGGKDMEGQMDIFSMMGM